MTSESLAAREIVASSVNPPTLVEGRSLVRVTERFYSGEMQVTFALTALAGLAAMVLASLGALGSGSWISVALSAVVIVLSLWGTRAAHEIYAAMRARPLLALVPASIIGVLIALDGSLDSPLYIPAQAMPVCAAIVGSVWLGVAASGVMGALYVAGLLVSGRTLSGDDQFLAAASVFGFLAWAGLFGYFAHALAGFVMRLPELVSSAPPRARPPRRVRAGVQVLAPAAPVAPGAISRRLTTRQLQVATLIARGMRSAAIARELGITESTVDRHAGAAMRRLGLTNRSQLAAAVVAAGLTLSDAD